MKTLVYSVARHDLTRICRPLLLAATCCLFVVLLHATENANLALHIGATAAVLVPLLICLGAQVIGLVLLRLTSGDIGSSIATCLAEQSHAISAFDDMPQLVGLSPGDIRLQTAVHFFSSSLKPDNVQQRLLYALRQVALKEKCAIFSYRCRVRHSASMNFLCIRKFQSGRVRGCIAAAVEVYMRPEGGGSADVSVYPFNELLKVRVDGKVNNCDATSLLAGKVGMILQIELA